MDEVQNFRTAFHGFNRDDVVSFLESLSSRHTAQVNQLKDDIRRLETQLENRPMVAANDADLKKLHQELEELRRENDALRQENESLKDTVSNLREQPDTQPESGLQEEELAAYRRAESVERLARQRASQLCDRVNGLVADLSARLAVSRQDMDSAVEDMGQSLEALQNALDASQETLRSGEASLQAFRMEA
ncbi:MAG: hypothetical protein ACI3V3_02400 [Faecousia sp.]